MTDAIPARIVMAGVGEDGQTVFAEKQGTRIIFGAELRDGRFALVDAPQLTPQQGRAWVLARRARFEAHVASRESAEEAIRRKALAAQGRPFIARLRPLLGTHGAKELAMMLSPDSHAQGEALARVRKGMPISVRVDVNGKVTGLPDSNLRDNDGQLLASIESA